MKVNIQELLKYEKKGLLNHQEHPEAPYLIWNYTHKCQAEQAWDSVTMMCRGLITDMDGNVLARPFDKFFNREEHDKEGMPMIPSAPFTLWDKLDGSLGILYYMPDGRPRLATRGSFESDQARYGTKMLEEIIGKKSIQFPQGYTFMFEIIYPKNRIVVNYGEEKKLVYLGARHITSGRVLTPNEIKPPYKFESAQQFDMKRLYEDPRENAEGFVLHYKTGLMVKVKYEEYVRLHRIVTGVNKRRIWDEMRQHPILDFPPEEAHPAIKEYVDNVPEEFRDWVIQKSHEIIDEALLIESLSLKVYEKALKLKTRKEQAMLILKEHKNVQGVAFALLDGKDYEHIIWKLIKPKSEPPFREDM